MGCSPLCNYLGCCSGFVWSLKYTQKLNTGEMAKSDKLERTWLAQYQSTMKSNRIHNSCEPTSIWIFPRLFLAVLCRWCWIRAAVHFREFLCGRSGGKNIQGLFETVARTLRLGQKFACIRTSVWCFQSTIIHIYISTFFSYIYIYIYIYNNMYIYIYNSIYITIYIWYI